MDINYRVGQIEDCKQISQGIDQASGGIMAFLFQGMIGNSVEVVAHILAKEEGHDTYRNAFVAQWQEEIVGMVYSYPAAYHGISEEMRGVFPAEQLAAITDFFTSRVEDSLFLDSIFVDDRFRGKGIGTELIKLTKERAKELHLSKVSLMVMADNTRARTVYDKNGFTIIKHVTLPEHRLIPHKGGAYLMATNV